MSFIYVKVSLFYVWPKTPILIIRLCLSYVKELFFAGFHEFGEGDFEVDGVFLEGAGGEVDHDDGDDGDFGDADECFCG